MLSSLLSVGYLLPIVARGFFLPPPGATADDDSRHRRGADSPV